jgi:hypothetical protein
VNADSGILFQNVLDGIRRCDIQIESISYDEWRAKLMSESKQNNLFKSVEEFFLHYSFKQKSTLCIEQHSNEASLFTFSPFDNGYIMKWLLFILNHVISHE